MSLYMEFSYLLQNSAEFIFCQAELYRILIASMIVCKFFRAAINNVRVFTRRMVEPFFWHSNHLFFQKCREHFSMLATCAPYRQWLTCLIIQKICHLIILADINCNVSFSVVFLLHGRCFWVTFWQASSLSSSYFITIKSCSTHYPYFRTKKLPAGNPAGNNFWVDLDFFG